MRGGFGEIADHRARDERVVRRAGRIEEAFCQRVGIVVPDCLQMRPESD